MADFAISAKAQDVNFVNKFEQDLHNLLAIMGKAEPTVLAPGTAFKIYAASGTLDAGPFAECEEIDDSGIKMGDATLAEITYQKYRNLVGIESIGAKGYEVAVGGANTAMLKQVQAKVRKSIIDALADGTGTADEGATFQATIANVAAEVQMAFEDEAVTPVFFVNPKDAYTYLGTTNVGLAQNYGLSYLENFMGIGDVIIDSNVPEGVIYGTAKENLEVVAADVSGIEGLELRMDASGVIGVHNGAAYANGALETVCYCGLCVMPVMLDRIFVAGEAESE